MLEALNSLVKSSSDFLDYKVIFPFRNKKRYFSRNVTKNNSKSNCFIHIPLPFLSQL